MRGALPVLLLAALALKAAEGGGSSKGAPAKKPDSKVKKAGVISSHIVKGTRAEDCELTPWQAYVVRDTTNACGGVIIGDRWILTAAHCLADAAATTPSLYEVTVGVINPKTVKSTGRMMFTSDKAIPHSAYAADTRANNIGLIRLLSLIPMAADDWPCARAIRLPKKSDLAKDNTGKVGMVSGWGHIKGSTSSGKEVTTLRTLNVTLLAQSECVAKKPDMTANQTCSSATSTLGSTCQGDDGGPLVIKDTDKKWTLLGIVGFNDPDPDCYADTVSVYEKVAAHLTWINKNTNITVQK